MGDRVCSFSVGSASGLGLPVTGAGAGEVGSLSLAILERFSSTAGRSPGTEGFSISKEAECLVSSPAVARTGEDDMLK